MEIAIVCVCLAMVSTIFVRALFFEAHNQKWYTSFIPGYSRVILGRISQTRLGLIDGWINSLAKVLSITYLVFILQLINKHGKIITREGIRLLQLNIPSSTVKYLDILALNCIILFIAHFILFSYMMRAYSIKRDGKRLTLVWLFCPLASYLYYTIKVLRHD